MVRETCLPRTFATVSYPSGLRPGVFRSQDSQEPQGSLGGIEPVGKCPRDSIPGENSNGEFCLIGPVI